MTRRYARRLLGLAIASGSCALLSCGTLNGFLFNSTFVNYQQGGVFPLTPGPSANFVLVRAVNSTDQIIRFSVTAQRRQPLRDDSGNVIRNPDGTLQTEDVLDNRELITIPPGKSSELGTLYACSESAIVRIGLGENLESSDSAAFVLDPAAFNPLDPLGVSPGFGVLPDGLFPLNLFDGDFNCGDTVVFRASADNSRAGGVRLESFVLPGSEQPTRFQGPSTFANYEAFLESQVREDD